MTYTIQYKEQALRDAMRLQKSEPMAYRKLQNLIEELKEHPCSGTGKPERLRGEGEGLWSRRITSKHRLVYRVYAQEVVVLVLSAYGHYDDK
ncbi:MAG: Txe/YoeB family addiction module toxin [Paludibacteraceae bacterium]